MKNEDLKGTFAIIGASGGIGSQLCHILAEKGADLFLGSRTVDQQIELPEGTRAEQIEVDATDWDSIDSFFEQAREFGEPIAGVALCVGSILLKPAHQTSKAEFDETIMLNLSSAFAVVRSAAKRMLSNGGSIALVSTAAALRGIPNHDAIAAAKGGVAALARSAAATYASYKIRVNCVAPGLVDTKMARSITGNETALKASAKMHPLGRIGDPKEVARALAWLLDPGQAWVTGQCIGVDGGLSTLMSKR